MDPPILILISVMAAPTIFCQTVLSRLTGPGLQQRAELNFDDVTKLYLFPFYLALPVIEIWINSVSEPPLSSALWWATRCYNSADKFEPWGGGGGGGRKRKYEGVGGGGIISGHVL